MRKLKWERLPCPSLVNEMHCHRKLLRVQVLVIPDRRQVPVEKVSWALQLRRICIPNSCEVFGWQIKSP